MQLKKLGLKLVGSRIFHGIRLNEWEEINEIADYAVDGNGDFDYKSIQKVF